MSDHFWVEARLKLVGGWRGAGRIEGVRNVKVSRLKVKVSRLKVKVSRLNNRVKKRAYQESLRGKYEVWRGGEVESTEKEW